MNLYSNKTEHHLTETEDGSRVVNRGTLIDEIKRGVKQIRVVVIRRSVTSWTNRVYKMLEREDEYLFETKIVFCRVEHGLSFEE